LITGSYPKSFSGNGVAIIKIDAPTVTDATIAHVVSCNMKIVMHSSKDLFLATNGKNIMQRRHMYLLIIYML